MNIKTTLLLTISSALLLSACNYPGPAATSTTVPTPTVTNPTATVSITSTTSSTNVNDLDAELNTTIDDGGQADLKDLQKDASGL